MIIKTRCFCGNKRLKPINIKAEYPNLEFEVKCRKCDSIYYYNLNFKSKIKYNIAILEINLIAKREG